MKRSYLLQGLFAALVIGVGLATAQNINKSVQFSQDPTGVFNVDTSNNLYFPKHWNTGDQSAPAVSGFGSAPSPSGSDAAGSVFISAGNPTTGQIKFAQAYTSTPYCTGQSTSNASPVGLIATPQGMSFTFNALAANAMIFYQCVGRSGG